MLRNFDNRCTWLDTANTLVVTVIVQRRKRDSNPHGFYTVAFSRRCHATDVSSSEAVQPCFPAGGSLACSLPDRTANLLVVVWTRSQSVRVTDHFSVHHTYFRQIRATRLSGVRVTRTRKRKRRDSNPLGFEGRTYVPGKLLTVRFSSKTRLSVPTGEPMPVKNSVRTEGTRGDYGIRTRGGITLVGLANQSIRPLWQVSKSCYCNFSLSRKSDRHNSYAVFRTNVCGYQIVGVMVKVVHVCGVVATT